GRGVGCWVDWAIIQEAGKKVIQQRRFARNRRLCNWFCPWAEYISSSGRVFQANKWIAFSCTLFGFIFSFHRWRPPVKRLLLAACLAAFASSVLCAQELTIESIYAPDTIEWSPDGKKVSYVLHEEVSGNAEGGGKADLYYIDVATGKPAVLVASDKIAAMTPPPSKNKDDRERDNRARYQVAGYHWSPDSQHILFD